MPTLLARLAILRLVVTLVMVPVGVQERSGEEMANLPFDLLQLGILHLGGSVEEDGLLDGEQALRTDETVHRQPALLQIGGRQRNGMTIGTGAAGDLAEDEVVAGEIGDDRCRPAFTRLEVGLRERQDDHIAD